jgi:hypothetical protein
MFLMLQKLFNSIKEWGRYGYLMQGGSMYNGGLIKTY